MMKKVAMISGANRAISPAVARTMKAAGHDLSLGIRNNASLPSDLSHLAKAGTNRIVKHAAVAPG